MRYVLLVLLSFPVWAGPREDFIKSHPCPVAPGPYCPCFTIEYIVPLDKGGKNHPSNMRWISLLNAGKHHKKP